MNCPYCGKEMEPGYVQCRDGVNWSPKKFFLRPLSSLHPDSISLANGAANSSTSVYAYNCSDCKKVIIDYSGDIK